MLTSFSSLISLKEGGRGYGEPKQPPPPAPQVVEPGAAGPPCPTAAGGCPALPLCGTGASKPLGFLWASSPPSSDQQQALPVTPS